MSSTRQGEARSALREVQSRHEDIKKIERTITELAQLFNEMNIMIEIQETTIDNIQQKAEETEQHVESGLIATERAVVSARGARRKKWYCIGIIALIISTSTSSPFAFVPGTNGSHCCRYRCCRQRSHLACYSTSLGMGFWWGIFLVSRSCTCIVAAS
jgi:Syntaxin/SNARE domain